MFTLPLYLFYQIHYLVFLYEIERKFVVTQGPTQPPVQTTPQQHHVGPTQKFNCQGKASGFYPDPKSCTSYYICAGSQGFEVTCASGLNFNPKTKYCDWPNNVQCMSGQSATNPPTQPPMTPQPQQTNPPQQWTQPPMGPKTTIPNMGNDHLSIPLM